MYIDIHTHSATKPNSWAIQNVHKNFETVHNSGCYTIGLHPWYINEAWQTDFYIISSLSIKQQVLAIGECGLDKVCATPFYLQELVFTQHIQLANKLHKPLIIHCVKAWEETFTLLQQQECQVPVIFHGFAKNLQLAQKIIDKGYYISFGEGLSKPTVQAVLAHVPLSQFFLETDDSSLDIETIYSLAAKAVQINLHSLSLQLKQNTEKVFGRKL